MKTIKISRTSSLARLRKRLSHPVKHLNTIIVGLTGIRDGIVSKPEDLAVRWEVGDPVRTTDGARGFAIASAMIAACDALDQYLHGLGSAASPVAQGELRTLLRGDSYIAMDGICPPGGTDTEQLARELATLDIKSGRIRLREFIDRHYGKTSKASLRARVDELAAHLASFPRNASAPEKPRESYLAAMTLLIAWRNKLVHEDSQDGIDPVKRKAMSDDAEFFRQNHAAIDIDDTLRHFDDNLPPTLKDVSTLVSILLRTVAAIDASLIYHVDLMEYFRETAWSRVRQIDKKIEFVSKLQHASLAGRAKALMPHLAGSGFVPEGFEDKKDAGPPRIVVLEETFLGTDEALEFLLSQDYLPSGAAGRSA